MPCIGRLSVVDRNPVCRRDLYPVGQYRWFPSDAASFVTFSKHFGTMQKPLHSPHSGTFSPQVQNQVDGNLIVYRCLNYFIKRIPNASALEDKQTKTAPNNAVDKTAFVQHASAFDDRDSHFALTPSLTRGEGGIAAKKGNRKESEG